MTTTDMIVGEAEQLKARVRELEAALRVVKGNLCRRVSGLHNQHAVEICASACDAIIDAALTPSEPRR